MPRALTGRQFGAAPVLKQKKPTTQKFGLKQRHDEVEER
jgi:hypothetical protein